MRTPVKVTFSTKEIEAIERLLIAAACEIGTERVDIQEIYKSLKPGEYLAEGYFDGLAIETNSTKLKKRDMERRLRKAASKLYHARNKAAGYDRAMRML
jgi:hypothetical protein